MNIKNQLGMFQNFRGNRYFYYTYPISLIKRALGFKNYYLQKYSLRRAVISGAGIALPPIRFQIVTKVCHLKAYKLSHPS